MTDKERDYRRYAGDDLMDAAKRAYGESDVWYIRYAIGKAEDWLKRVETLQVERKKAEADEALRKAYPELADVA